MNFILIFALLAAGKVLPWDPCTWPNPKLNFDQEAQVDELLHFAKLDRSQTVQSGSKVFANNQIYYFASSSAGIDVCADRRTCFRMTIPEFSYRPVDAKWINEKLLYVEMTFNPHAGAYWLIDVESEKIVYSEHWLDDLVHWLECNKQEK